jgi:hypothetical protein
MIPKLSPSVRATLHFCGSIQFAMLLLAVIIFASIFGTFVESGFNAKVAQAYVYDAPWFIAWLTMLCVNLMAAVLVRYPWKAHQWGFVIVHAGIVVILVGAIIGRIWGMEGHITLVQGAPRNALIANEIVLQVQGQGEEMKTFPLRRTAGDPTPEKPLRYRSGDMEIEVTQMADELGIRQVVEPGPNGVPAVRLIMTGDAAPHPIDRWLVKDNPQRGRLSMGSNLVIFSSLANAAEQPAAAASSREIHFAFARMSGGNMTRVLEGNRSDATVQYRFPQGDPDGTRGSLLIRMDGQEITFPVSEIQNLSVPLPGTEWTLRNLRYFSDFRMEGTTPVNVSDEPNNPAVFFELVGPAGKTGHDGCCPDDPKPVPAHAAHQGYHANILPAGGASADACCPEESHAAPQSQHASVPAAKPAADACCPHEEAGGAGGKGHPAPSSSPHHHQGARTVLAQHSEDGNSLTLRYEAGQLYFHSRTPEGETSGPIAIGQDFSPGWAGWSFRIEEVIEKAVVREQLAPFAGHGMRRIGASGLHVRLDDGIHQTEGWLRMGTMSVLPLGEKRLHLGYGFRLYPLDFTVELERFEVEFNPGTQTPASFKSHVTFTSASGEKLSRAVWMNNPTNFPHFFGAGLLGTSYKFSQSSWNPEDLSQTTLQVIRDPGWSLKWIGSLLLCGGLIMVFYLKPYPQFAREKNVAKRKDTDGAAKPVSQPRAQEEEEPALLVK